MTDITKCDGKGCPEQLRENCYRFTAEASEYQSYIAAPIKKDKNGIYSYEFFWGERQDDLLNYLNKIIELPVH